MDTITFSSMLKMTTSEGITVPICVSKYALFISVMLDKSKKLMIE